MARDKFETKLERFVINHYNDIGFVNSLVFLVGLVASLLIGNPATLGAFTAITVGCTIAGMVLGRSPRPKANESLANQSESAGRRSAVESGIRSRRQVNVFFLTLTRSGI